MANAYGRLIYNAANSLGQPWHWNVASAGNNKDLARSSETYTHRKDCIYSYDMVVGRGRITLYEFKDGKTATPVTDVV